MEISNSEKMAIDLIKNYPELIQQVLTPEGNIEINKLYDFYNKFHRQLELSHNRRKGLFEDISPISDIKDLTEIT